MEEKFQDHRQNEPDSVGWEKERIASWESPDYIQRVEDREQERYLAEWCRKHEKRNRK